MKLKTLRIYYKRTGTFPFVWSFDRGHIRSQRVVKDFHIHGTWGTSGGTDFDTEVENSPHVFVKVHCATYKVVDGELHTY